MNLEVVGRAALFTARIADDLPAQVVEKHAAGVFPPMGSLVRFGSHRFGGMREAALVIRIDDQRADMFFEVSRKAVTVQPEQVLNVGYRHNAPFVAGGLILDRG